MSLVFSSILECKKMLTNLDTWLGKGVEQAKARSFDPDVLLAQRLAPDQYPLIRQIQSACDNAKFLAARLTAKEPPKHPDTEKTMDEARVRIRAVVSHLETYKEADFNGAETRVVTLPFLEGKVVDGKDYLMEMGLPNFFFHVMTAYSILRHNGVSLGKFDYIGTMNVRDK